MKLLIRKMLSYIIDYSLIAIFGGLYLFCANVFLLDKATENQAVTMLVCALVTVLIITCYIPTKYNGQTVGQKIMKLRVENKNGKDRTYLQSFLRECVLKISFGIFFIIFTSIYFVVFNVIINHDLNNELPHDFILKTKLVAL